MITNNVTRLLNSRRISYKAFELPQEKMGADETARYLHVDPWLVYKTILVLRDKGKSILAVIPGPHRVDLRLLAAEILEKKLTLPTEREAERITGLQAGGISPLALLQKGFQIILSSEAIKLPEIYISGGQRGLNLLVPVESLVDLTHARVATISRFDENKNQK